MTSNDEPFLDSYSLMAAMFHAQIRSQALTDFVCNTDQMAQITGNSLVKEKLVAFLQADIAFRNAVTEYLLLPRLTRLNRFSKTKKQKEESLGKLKEQLTEAHRELEMIRKLAMPDNSLLMMRPYDFTLQSKSRRSRQSRP